jgi:predicted RNA binding protein YcfA (HicA-like mRNA interferase family)
LNIPSLNAKQLIRILLKKGFIQARQSGNHIIFKHPDGRRTTVPFHSSKDIGTGLLRQIMKDAGITPDDIMKFK